MKARTFCKMARFTFLSVKSYRRCFIYIQLYIQQFAVPWKTELIFLKIIDYRSIVTGNPGSLSLPFAEMVIIKERILSCDSEIYMRVIDTRKLKTVKQTSSNLGKLNFSLYFTGWELSGRKNDTRGQTDWVYWWTPKKAKHRSSRIIIRWIVPLVWILL